MRRQSILRRLWCYPVPQYVNPAGDEYPVVAYNNYAFPYGLDTYEDEMLDELATIKSCGFNVTAWIGVNRTGGISTQWKNHISMYYKAAASLGLRSIYILQNEMPLVVSKPSDSSQPDQTVYSPSLETIAEILNLNKDDGNLWGYKLADEPKFNQWAYTTPTAAVGIKDLPALYRTYLQNANGHVGFLTLGCGIFEDAIGSDIYNGPGDGKQKYGKYLRAIKDKFNPSLLTVDIYPVIKYCSRPGNSIDFQNFKIITTYYYILETIADFSTQTNIKFWMYILSTQHNLYSEDGKVLKWEYPFPTIGILRYQAMNALAFGFQGLVFWTYPLHGDKYVNGPGSLKEEEYITAPYVDGKTTDVWYNCHIVNSEIQLYGKLLLDARFLEAGHVYGSSYAGKQFPLTSLFSSYKGIGCIANASTEGTGFVITRLEKDSQKFVVIASHDPYYDQEISLTLCARCRWTEFVLHDSSDGYLVEYVHEREDNEKTVSRILKSGGIILIRYECI